jgi:hypothetical protein
VARVAIGVSAVDADFVFDDQTKTSANNAATPAATINFFTVGILSVQPHHQMRFASLRMDAKRALRRYWPPRPRSARDKRREHREHTTATVATTTSGPRSQTRTVRRWALKAASRRGRGTVVLAKVRELSLANAPPLLDRLRTHLRAKAHTRRTHAPLD